MIGETERRRRISVLCCALTFVSCILATSLAQAQPAPNERVLAETLFREGRALLEENKVSEACAKLAESQRLEPRPGTLLNLAICHEREGKTASAWAEYTDAATQAYRVGHAERERFATKKARELEGKLTHIIVTVESPLDTLELQLDGQVLGKAIWGTQLPIDPGPHRLAASATAHRPWVYDFSIEPGAERRVLPVPPLEPDPVIDRPAEQPVLASTTLTPHDLGQRPPPAAPSKARNTAAFASLTAGTAFVITGGVFGLRAFSKHASANEHCDDKTCTQAGLQLDAAARTSATLSTAAFAVGLTGIGAGVYLMLTGRASEPSRASAAPLLSPSLAGATLRGSF